jgi:hypothetical protein
MDLRAVAAVVVVMRCGDDKAAAPVDANDARRWSFRVQQLQHPRDFLAVLVAAAGEVDQEDFVALHVRRELGGLGEGVAAFQGGEDAFELRDLLEGFERFIVSDAEVLDPAGILPIGMLGADAGVVEAGADGVDVGGLAIFVL